MLLKFLCTESAFFPSSLSKRDPHLYRTVTNKGDVRINRNKNLEWSRYDPNYKKYLSIGKSAAACSCDVQDRLQEEKKNLRNSPTTFSISYQ